MTYAKDTTVSIERSKTEIEKILARYGGKAFVRGEAVDERHTYIEFLMNGRGYRLVMKMPDREQYRRTPTGRGRTIDAQTEAWEKECRRRWRALVLVTKAKLEAVESGISTLEHEFMADMLLPDNNRVETWLAPQLDEAYSSGRMPLMLQEGIDGRQ